MTQTRTNTPPLNADTVTAMVIAGSVATVAFDLWGQAISPMLGFANLAPVGLARSLLGTFGLPNAAWAGNFMHLFLVGLIAYPVGWLYIFRPLQQKFAPGMPMLLSSAIYGFGLWIFAIGGITSVAGLKFFLGFTGITWVALVGHVLYGIVAAITFDYLARRR
ncbi:DUF6789 family protein [Paracoccus zeaxanthinifaciens]|uniref:DUF6789 family protein n=1 Tax=Paracoccus zeaxanthinifaciens TaxID=187400 RepID=UPI0003B6D23F|nr:DUF6789 family protein [Paracoccus zeaxanthinifaciens]